MDNILDSWIRPSGLQPLYLTFPPYDFKPPSTLIRDTMANFVRAQIFGTTFEITSRYTDLQPVGMGAFGLVWYHTPRSFHSLAVQNTPPFILPGKLSSAGWLKSSDAIMMKLCQGSAHGSIRCCQENHETLQHARSSEADLSRIKAPQASQARKCTSTFQSFPLKKTK